MIYCAILFLLVCLSLQYDINGAKKGRDIWYGFMLVAFILVAGLRWRIGIDTPSYLYNFYHEKSILLDGILSSYCSIPL